MNLKVAMIVGYDPIKDRDGVGLYTEKLFNEIAGDKFSDAGVQCDVHYFRPDTILEWVKGLNRIFANYDVVHMQYPSEGWAESIMPGILPFLLKMIHLNTKVLVTFHEWHSMHFLRKLSIIPLALISNSLIFVSTIEKDSFINSLVYKLRLKKPRIDVIPIGVNVHIPRIEPNDVISKRHSFMSWNDVNSDMLIGYFGFIYEWKQPYKMLECIHELHSSGVKARLILAGDFPVDHQSKKDDFLSTISSMGLDDYVLYLGYVEDEVELAETLSACNVSTLLFHDGVSARRGSFWYIVELGLSLISTKPRHEQEFGFDLNDLFVSGNRLELVASDISPVDLSDVVNSFSTYAVPVQSNGVAPRWSDIAKEHLNNYLCIK